MSPKWPKHVREKRGKQLRPIAQKPQIGRNSFPRISLILASNGPAKITRFGDHRGPKVPIWSAGVPILPQWEDRRRKQSTIRGKWRSPRVGPNIETQWEPYKGSQTENDRGALTKAHCDLGGQSGISVQLVTPRQCLRSHRMANSGP